jgi:excisionase family DNA binding protein
MSGRFDGGHRPGMTRPQRDPIVRLLTTSEAASELGVSVPALDRMVRTGAIGAVRVSAQRGRRFWPRDIAAWRRSSVATSAPEATSASSAPASTPSPVPAAAPSAVAVVPNAAVKSKTTTRRSGSRPSARPRWLPFATATKRVRPSYLGFADVESLILFLRLRASPLG